LWLSFTASNIKITPTVEIVAGNQILTANLLLYIASRKYFCLVYFVDTQAFFQIFQILHTMSNSDISLLKDYDKYPPLPTTTHRSGKGLALDPLPPRYTLIQAPSSAYSSFPFPITSDFTTGGFDAHICFELSSAEQVTYATQLQTRIKYEFPELRTYEIFEEPAGPFVTGSFEVSLRTPLELGALTAWLMMHRGPLSVLVHSNTDGTGEDDIQASVGDHTLRAFWLGDRRELNLSFFSRQKRG
jgi:aromatic ring-cleaving dioxygenase